MYFQIALMNFKHEFAHRAHTIASVMNSLLEVTILWFLWGAIFNAAATETIRGFTFELMVTYIAISTLINFSMSSWLEHDIEEDVRTGKIANILTKPSNYILFRTSSEFGRLLFKVLIRGLPLMLISFFILNIALPSSPLFFVSVSLGIVVNMLFSILIGMWSFWSRGSVWGIKLTKKAVSELLSGAIIPLYFFPHWLKTLAEFLPFQAVFNIPLSIYIGRIAGYEIINSLGIQLVWITILGSLSYVIWKNAEKRVMVYGG